MSNITNQESSKHAVTLEKVLKSKPFDALCKAAEVGLGLPNAKQKTRDELAELLSKAMLANLAGWVENWICVLDGAVAEIVHGMVFDGPQTLSLKIESERYVAEALSTVFWIDCRTWKEGRHAGDNEFAIPEEIRDYCKRDGIFEDIRAMGDYIVGIAASAVNLYGVVSLEELQSLVDRYVVAKGIKRKGHLFDLSFIACVVRGREYDESDSYFTWKDWVCHPEFEKEKEHRDELIKLFISERDKHERWYPKDMDELLSFDNEYSFLDMPECEELEAFLGEHGFVDEDDRAETLLCAVQQVQIDTMLPGVIMNAVIEKCAISTQEQAEEICRLWMNFVNNIHRRSLNGQTPMLAVSLQKDIRPPVIKVNPRADIGRNDLCPCGSGRKFKQCCGKKAKKREAESAAARERLSVYLPMRELTMRFVSKCVMPLCTDEIFNSAAERIGIGRRDSMTEDAMSTLSAVIGDYAVMMNDRLGIPPIKRVIADADKFSGDRLRALDMYRQYRYTWLKILDVEPGVGMKCRDLMTGEEGFLMETSLSRSYGGYGVRDMTLCAGIGSLPNGTWMALGTISPAGFDNPELILKIVLSHLGLTSDIPIQLSFSDQARFAAETIKRIYAIGRYNNIKYGGLANLND